MGLLDIIGNVLGGGSKNRQPAAYGAQRPDPYMMLLSRNIGKAHLHQKRFGQLIAADQNWNLDLGNAQIYFGNQSYRIELLGTESKRDNSWMWAFANPTGYPEELIQGARLAYRFCEENGTHALSRPQVTLTPLINGHTISSIAAASRNDGVCYYRCPYNQNTSAYVLVHGLPAQVFVPSSAQEIMTAFTALTQQYPLDHRLLVQNTLEGSCIRLENRNGFITGFFRDGTEIHVTFDRAGRIASMNTQAPA